MLLVITGSQHSGKEGQWPKPSKERGFGMGESLCQKPSFLECLISAQDQLSLWPEKD